MRSRWLVVLVLIAGACSGGGDEGSSDDSSSSGSASSADEETTTTEAEVDVELPTSFRAEGGIDAPGFETVLRSAVADPTHYDLVFESDVSHFRILRVGDEVFLRTAPDAATAEGRLFSSGTPEDSTALAFLLDSASFGPIESEFAVSGAETATDALTELLFTDPAELLDADEVDPNGVFDVELPAEIAGALEDLEVDEPALEARVDLDDDGDIVRVELRISSDDDVDIDVEARYDDLDDVTEDDIEAPAADRIDVTPFVDEEELATYQETPLLVPPAPPEGMALVTAVVLDAFESREGCQQVQLDYAPPDDPFSDEFVEYFLIDKTCMNQFDPTPFDEVTGGFPSRYDGFEILVGTTVVQLASGDDDLDLATFVASLVPVTADLLIASVVPPPD